MQPGTNIVKKPSKLIISTHLLSDNSAGQTQLRRHRRRGGEGYTFQKVLQSGSLEIPPCAAGAHSLTHAKATTGLTD